MKDVSYEPDSRHQNVTKHIWKVASESSVVPQMWVHTIFWLLNSGTSFPPIMQCAFLSTDTWKYFQLSGRKRRPNLLAGIKFEHTYGPYMGLVGTQGLQKVHCCLIQVHAAFMTIVFFFFGLPRWAFFFKFIIKMVLRLSHK